MNAQKIISGGGTASYEAAALNNSHYCLDYVITLVLIKLLV
jgi:hypothetical protein